MASQLSFMSIPEALGEHSKSFEEVRFDDYIKSYTTTGRPPVPVPQIPTGDKERAALNLPQLFKPAVISDAVTINRPLSSSQSTPSRSNASKTNPAELPLIQEFKHERIGGETLCNIVCSDPYSFFSPEELRYYAYQKGSRSLPQDQLQSVAARPEFSQHSFEELRVVYMLAGREMTSPEIIAAMQGR